MKTHAFLRLIRYKNLIMMALMMLMMKLCVIDPIIKLFNLTPTFTYLDFVILTLAQILVAAGGYIINDYFDMKADRINRPDTQIVGGEVTRGSATNYHLATSIAGCVLGMLVSMRVGFWPLGLIFPFEMGLLWFYSSAYKGMFLVGNLVVAFLVATLPFLPSLYEYRGLIAVDDPAIQAGAFDPTVIIYWSAGMAAFAFLTTMMREIIKDIEDIEGDTEQGCRTMPIVIGITASKIVASILILATIAGVVFAYYNYLGKEFKSGIYLGVAVVLPLIFLLVKLIMSSTKAQFHLCSTISKIIMLLGMLYLVIVWYNFTYFKVEDILE
ncbi:MAG: geranylgeranylglycerol-phosphate geranylgeranyltransferase [Bacteroidales bacterium]|nr:geranylgeranylglycerol-phosphate geranylgeranyltransferase [Bacteroidales bacterium]